MAITVPNPTSPTESVAGYHAAVVHEFDAPLTVEQVPWRELQPGQILVQVEACGLCHTDIHAAHGDWPIKPSPPFIPGHEGVGIVQELGPGVTEVACGDRVAMPWLGYACGTCDYCVSGRETLCESQENMGYSIDGAFGEYAGRLRAIRREGPGRHRCVRRRAAHLRRRDHLQGGQGRRHPLVRPRRRVRRRWARASRDPVRRDRRRPRDRGRPASTRSSSSRASWAPSSPSTPPSEDPVEAIKALGGADQAIALAVSPRVIRAGLRIASPRRHARVRRASRRQPGHAADLRDRAERASRSSARSSAPEPTCVRCSSCTPPGRRR